MYGDDGKAECVTKWELGGALMLSGIISTFISLTLTAYMLDAKLQPLYDKCQTMSPAIQNTNEVTAEPWDISGEINKANDTLKLSHATKLKEYNDLSN